MNIQEITGFDVTGVTIRTSNQQETHPQTAKISTLWQAFFTHIAPKLTQHAKVYGIYTHYESDQHGLFDVIAGSDALTLDSLKDMNNVSNIHIPSGKYLTFSATGNMPETVITLWQKVWQYFNDADCPYQRAYTLDFEYYKTNHENDNEIEIFIAIK